VLFYYLTEEISLVLFNVFYFENKFDAVLNMFEAGELKILILDDDSCYFDIFCYTAFCYPNNLL
jgi:hypothetical protein